MRMFDSPERCVLVLFVRFRFAKSMNSNMFRRSLNFLLKGISQHFRMDENGPFSYSTKEPGSSDIFIQFYTRGSIEWR